jgi:pyruvate,water dikinase
MFTRFFDEIKEPEISELGGKGYSLVVLVNSGINVPRGFIITSEAFLEYLRENNLMEKVQKLVLDENENNFREKSREIKKLVLSGKIPENLKQEVKSALDRLKANYVSIRSSAIGEDSREASFAGLYDTFLNIKSKVNVVLKHVKKCWASLFNEKALIYRVKKGISLIGGMAVIVQEMINSDVSGVAFTQHPLQKEALLIDAAYGLGLLITSGKIVPDSFLVSKRDFSVIDASISTKRYKYKVDKTGKVKKVRVPPYLRDVPPLSSNQLRELCKIFIDIENLFKEPQDIEWCLYNNKIYTLQSRAITSLTLSKRAMPLHIKEIEEMHAQVLDGIPASPGKVKGIVKVISKKSDLENVRDKCILVVRRASPEILSIINNISGIISEEGSVVSHVAVIAREFMIPCVVGVVGATEILKDNMTVKVDGSTGKIYILDHVTNTSVSLIGKRSRENPVYPVRLEDLIDIDKLIESGVIVLSSMGRKVVQTPGFKIKWRNFILSLTPEKIVDSWRDTLGRFLALLVEVRNEQPFIELLEKLVAAHNDFYMYNLLVDCYYPYLLLKQIVDKYTSPQLNSKIIELLIDYSFKYRIPYNQLKEAIYFPLPSEYIPLSIYRTNGASYKSLLEELGKTYILDKKRYLDMLSNIEKGKLDALNLEIKVHTFKKLRKKAYEIFSNILKSEDLEKFELYAKLIEYFEIINDINRLVAKEFAEDVKKIVSILVKRYGNIKLKSEWPWEQMLELYIHLHGESKLERR